MKCENKHWSGRFICNLPEGHTGNHMQLIEWKDKPQTQASLKKAQSYNKCFMATEKPSHKSCLVNCPSNVDDFCEESRDWYDRCTLRVPDKTP